MIRALIVDDEYFVRKGLIHMVPWGDYNIEIAGEASNGEKALEMLGEMDVQLLITDITMPIMSGFELITKVKELYLDLWIVVLTCHQDFHYAREAIRKGAIDYIVKTELEDSLLNESIQRISERIAEEQERLGQLTLSAMPVKSESKWGIYMIPALKSNIQEPPPATILQILMNGESALKVQDNELFIHASQIQPNYRNKEYIMSSILLKDWIVVIIDLLPVMPDQGLIKFLTQYKETVLFYEYRFTVSIVETNWPVIEQTSVLKSSMEEVEKQWKEFNWVYEDSEFNSFDENVRAVKPPVKEWSQSLKETLATLSYCKAELEEDWIQILNGFQFWEQWNQWLVSIRPRFRTTELSEEIGIRVLRSVQIMLDEIETGIGQTEVSKRVHINRSYFSYCFKQCMSVSFHDLMNSIRVEKAKSLLENTSQPIYSVAEKVGFQDDKYFSKFFKQQTGKLPSELRRQP